MSDLFPFPKLILHLLFPLTLSLFVLLITEWLWLPLSARVGGLRCRVLPQRQAICRQLGNPLRARSIVIIVLSAVLGASIPLSQLSPDRVTGLTAPYYLSVLTEMDKLGMQVAFFTDRPFFFVILHLVGRVISWEPFALLRALPVALGAGLSVATYLFMHFSRRSDMLAGLAATFAAFSPHLAVGVDYFLVANWLAVILMMAFFTSFARALRSRSVFWGALTVAISALTLGVHYSSWLFMMSVVLVYLLLVMAAKRIATKKDLAFCMALVVSCIVAAVPAVVSTYLIGGDDVFQPALHMLQTFVINASPINFARFLTNEEALVLYLSREHYAIPLTYALALIGFAGLHSPKDAWEYLLKSWMISSCLGVLLVHYDELWRFLYLMPIEVMAALGLESTLRVLVGSRRALKPGVFSL